MLCLSEVPFVRTPLPTWVHYIMHESETSRCESKHCALTGIQSSFPLDMTAASVSTGGGKQQEKYQSHFSGMGPTVNSSYSVHANQ